MSLCILTFLQSIVMGLAYASTGVFRSVTPLLGKLVVGYFQILSSSLFLHLSFSFFFFEVCLTGQPALLYFPYALDTHIIMYNFPHPLSWCSL